METSEKKTQNPLMWVNITLVIITIFALGYAFNQRQFAKEQEERANAASEAAMANGQKAVELTKEILEYKKQLALNQSKIATAK